MTKSHLVILKKPYVDAILDGRKTIESRFTKIKRAPFGQVSVGDKLFLKISSGPVCATAEVAAVKNFENLTSQKISELRQQYNRQILAGDDYWESKSDSRFGFLIWLGAVKPMEPVYVKKKDWRAWVVLTKSENFGLYA
ncbi:hypothetical protein ES708_32393 [subsurface metagenome]